MQILSHKDSYRKLHGDFSASSDKSRDTLLAEVEIQNREFEMPDDGFVCYDIFNAIRIKFLIASAGHKSRIISMSL